MSREDIIAIIGAGPAGMAAATLLARHVGDRVVVFDDQPAPGGQIYRAIERNARDHPVRMGWLGADYAHGAELVRAFRESGALYRPETSVWQVTDERDIHFSCGGKSASLKAAAVICATGAIERPVPRPGWTLPGVMTAGGLQILMKTSGLTPDVPVVLAGSGPLLLLLASQMIAAGCPPAAVLETTTRSARLRALTHLPFCALHSIARGYLWKGFRMERALRAGRVPHHRDVSNIRLLGNDELEAVLFTAAGREERIDAKVVALHEGVIPNPQLGRSLGCEYVWDERSRCFLPRTDGHGATSRDNIYIAGDAAGITGAYAAEHGGRVAALRLLKDLGRLDAAEYDRQVEEPLGLVMEHAAIRPLLDTMFPPPAEIRQPCDETIICRCEEVRAGALRQAIALGCQGPNQAKTYLRCGMGPCQGRLCGMTVSEIFSGETGQDVGTVGYYNIRPPITPITIGELVRIEAATT